MRCSIYLSWLVLLLPALHACTARHAKPSADWPSTPADSSNEIIDHPEVIRDEHGASPEAISLHGRPLYPLPPSSNREKLEADLAAARADQTANPNDPDKLIWVGRRLAYLWRMQEAIGVFTEGIRRFPDHAAFYRHRGHRYISIRKFDEAVADLERAVKLIEGKPDTIEPDGQPNARKVPLTTLSFNVWYHLGVARYLKGDFAGARVAFRNTMKFTRGYDDNLVAVTDWLYLTLRRMNRHQDARILLQPITARMNILENHAYYRRLRLYQGKMAAGDLLAASDAGTTDYATLGYGVGQWYIHKGRTDDGVAVLERVVAADAWPAFGFIAAEVDLKRLRR